MADQVPLLTTSSPSITEMIKSMGKMREFINMQDKIVLQIVSDNPKFFTVFKEKIQSWNQVVIKKVLINSTITTLRAVQKLPEYKTH
ncbi:hypothetical protein E5J99_06140 [Hymenobacter elongatus]|uniref:Uncharacterized protein n=1 Tax=Hymenobacter elongatus TaxID=877208 RepID=A0A4Z0PPY6_9BACT|nr:hypothetical protein E5J99_06140 [Hymenobacter elongatus]